MFWRKTILILVLSFLVFPTKTFFVQAETTNDLQAINDEIAARKAKVDQINSQISEYQKKIDQAESQQASLSNEVELLNNRVAQSELEITVANEESASLDDEIRVIDNSIAEKTAALQREQEMIKVVLREIRAADKTSMVDWVLGSQSFSELFDQAEKLETINSDLNTSLNEVKSTKDTLQAYKTDQENKLIALEDLQKVLEKKIVLLNEEKESKFILIEQTAASEDKFNDLLNNLQAEEQYVNRQISSLQNNIEQKLKDNDLAGDSSALSWPVTPLKGISATFHDPTYPFRHMFEHPGTDIPTPVGTPIKSSAPGYVAWVRLGQLYGNYILVIHADGVATLYAHLSKILVETDQFVARGETIALSGGQPGMAGAGMSTGPHLHFEVRKDGIPTNPMNYLVSY
ncbi:MAG: peptidoglycan DD-metalloendopeptidase family protein [Candidatus Uhrbacteria bacterium]